MKNLLYFFSLMLVIFSCKKDREYVDKNGTCKEETKVFVTDPELIKYTAFNNQNWVFQDSMHPATFDTLFCSVRQELASGASNDPCSSTENFIIDCNTPFMMEFYGRRFFIHTQDLSTASISLVGKTAKLCHTKTPQASCLKHDSLLILNRYHRNVIQSDTINFDWVGKSYKWIIFYNNTAGFLKSNLYDATSKLLSSKMLVSSTLK